MFIEFNEDESVRSIVIGVADLCESAKEFAFDYVCKQHQFPQDSTVIENCSVESEQDPLGGNIKEYRVELILKVGGDWYTVVYFFPANDIISYHFAKIQNNSSGD